MRGAASGRVKREEKHREFGIKKSFDFTDEFVRIVQLKLCRAAGAAAAATELAKDEREVRPRRRRRQQQKPRLDG